MCFEFQQLAKPHNRGRQTQRVRHQNVIFKQSKVFKKENRFLTYGMNEHPKIQQKKEEGHTEKMEG
jgi:hypothetical protein